MEPVTTATRLRGAEAVLVAAILLLALDLRGPIIAVSSVTGPVGADLHVDASTVGLLTSLPVLCFGLATSPASALLGRLGLARGVLVSLLALAAGIVVRSLDGLATAIAGTLLIGMAITVGNVAVPVVIGRDLRRHAGLVLGMYTAALNVGSMLALSVTAPIAAVTGWRPALATGLLLAALAAAVWWWATRSWPGTDAAPVAQHGHPQARNGHEGGSAEPREAGAWWRRPVVWGLTVAFSGQAFAYYGMTAWLPVLLADRLGMDAATAGVSASIFQVAAIAGAFGIPALMRACPAPRVAIGAVVLAWLFLPLGLLIAPAGWALWCALGGVAQGGGLTAIFALVVRTARDVAENRHISALVQGGGYTVAATGPFVVGAVHEASGGWTAPLLVELAAILVLLVAGMAAAGRVAR